MQTQRDLFSELRELISCSYISDLRYEPYKSAAKVALSRLNLTEYPLPALCDAAEYLYGVNLKFEDYAQAKVFFEK